MELGILSAKPSGSFHDEEVVGHGGSEKVGRHEGRVRGIAGLPSPPFSPAPELWGLKRRIILNVGVRCGRCLATGLLSASGGSAGTSLASWFALLRFASRRSIFLWVPSNILVESCSVTQAGVQWHDFSSATSASQVLVQAILVLNLLSSWDYRCAPPHPADFCIFGRDRRQGMGKADLCIPDLIVCPPRPPKVLGLQ
ncbi:hypothetical protein AAY473_037526, partial [Plecturocebus cupreus]